MNNIEKLNNYESKLDGKSDSYLQEDDDEITLAQALRMFIAKRDNKNVV